jgi:hypothetical protein
MKLVRDTMFNLQVLVSLRDLLLLVITQTKGNKPLTTSLKALYLNRGMQVQVEQSHPGLRLQVTTSSNMISITQIEGKVQPAEEELFEAITEIF